MAVSLFIWRALVDQEHAHIRQVIELRAKDLKTNTERLLESQAQALLRMVKRWEKQGKTPKEEWELDARLYVTHYSFYQAIEWADASFHVRWIVPLEGNEKAQDLNLAFEERRRTALEKARDRQEITVTRTIDLVQGEKGFLVNLPIYLGKDFDGFILGVFRINKLFPFLLTDKDLSRYSITVYDDEEEVYSHESHNWENGDKWSIEKEIKFHNLTWRILICPSQELFAELQSIVPEIALITGLFMSLFIALTVYFFQKALFRAKDVEITNQSLLHEIIERRQAEDMLQKSRDEWVQTFDAISDHVCILDVSGTIVKANKTMRDRFEPIHGNLTGLDYRLIYCGTATPDPQPPCASVLSGGPVVTCVTRLPTMEGWQLVTSYPITDSNGKQWGAVSVVRDITERMGDKEALQKAHDELEERVEKRTAELTEANKALERAVAEHKRAEEEIRKLSNAVEQSPVVVMITDSKGIIEYVNPKFTQITGYTTEEVIGTNAQLGAQSPEENRRLWNTITSSLEWQGEFYNKKKNGQCYWEYASISHIRNQEGAITHFIKIAEDRTKHKQLEDSLRESEERLRAILDNAAAVIYMKDIQGRYLFINRQFEKLINITRGQIRNRTDNELFPAEIAEALQANDRKVLESKIPLEFDEKVSIDDELCTYLSVKFPLFDSTGAISAICGISTDITERKRMEEIVRNIAEGVSAKTGNAFFRSLVLHIAKMLNVDYVMVCKLIPESNEVETIALSAHGGMSDNFVYPLRGTLCEKVLEKGLLMYYEKPQQQFPEEHSLVEMGVESYMGIPLTDSNNYPLGLLVIMGKKEMKDVKIAESLLKIFAIRASSELERERAERTLRESETRLSEAQRIAHIGSWEWDIIKNKTYHSAEVYRIFGQSPQEFGDTYEAFLSHVHPDDREFVRKSVDEALYERKPYDIEYRTHFKDKTVRFVQEKAIIMFDNMGIRPIRMVGTLQDITERRQAREEIKLLQTILVEMGVSKDLHEALIITIRKVCEMAGFVYGEAWKPDPGGAFLERDHAFYSVDEGLSKYSLFTEGMTFPRNTGLPGRAWSKKQPVWIRDVTQELEYLHTQIVEEVGFKMGVAFPVIANDEVVTVIVFYQKEAKESDERLVNLISTVVAQLGPMIRHKQIEEALRESEERFRQLAENIRQVFWMATPQMNQILYVSPAYEEIWGRTCKSLYDFPGTWFESIHPPDRDKVLMIFQEKRVQTMLDIKYRIVRSDGSIRWIQSQAFPVCNKSGEIYRIVGISEDISEIKQTEEEQSRLREQLERVSRLESIGKLAGGIAHDFNNILTVISGYGQLLNNELKNDDPLKAYVQKIITSTERAVQLTQGLLAFSRKQVTNPKAIEINEIIRSSEGLMRRLLGEDIQLTIIPVDRKCVVMADSGQIEQVLMNLATNARDAMPHGGEIIIHTNIVELDNEYRKTYGYGVLGNYFLISFSDTGEGMDRETRERIFEPYFTTKEVGKGTGLGLSIVYGIVKQHNGYINAYSEPGKGTLFKIYLPLIESEVVEKGSETHIPATGGTETILLAEDESEVRNLVKIVLERNGYKVIEATDGEEAIQKFMEHKDEINLLVFDVVMPKKSGKSAYDTIKKMNPDVKILFMSGYSEDIIHKRGVIVEKGLKYATKPIFPTELLKIIRELLDKPFERNT